MSTRDPTLCADIQPPAFPYKSSRTSPQHALGLASCLGFHALSMRVLRAVKALASGWARGRRDRNARAGRPGRAAARRSLPTSTTQNKTRSRNVRAARAMTVPDETEADETVRNAVAFLTQEDAESALVYALVHDPEFRLASALATVPAGADVNVIRALLFVFEGYEDQLRKLLGLLMFREMVSTLNWNELFRANSATTALLREYTCELGTEFLQHALGDVIAELWTDPEGYEVNPRYLQPEDDLQANQQRLEALAERVLAQIFSAAPLFPYQVAKIYRVLELEMLRLLERDRRSNVSLPRLSTFGSGSSFSGAEYPVEERKSASVDSGGRLSALPRLSSIDEATLEDLFTQSGSSCSSNSVARDEFLLHLGGLVFLRFLCPALVVPHKMHLTPGNAAPSRALQRTLVLLAKLLQSLANHAEYGASAEPFMQPFNAFLARNRPKLARFYEQLCQQAQHDNRRESAVARSNATPRISQLWASRSSSSLGQDLAIVNLTGARVLEAPDAAFSVLRAWMRGHLDYLAIEVADNSKFRRHQHLVVSGSSSGSGSGSSTPPTTTTSATTLSPAKPKRKRRVKRKLKSSKSKSPFPAEIQEEDEEEKTSDDSKSSQHRTAAMPVSMEELDEVMGRTSHRDNQLMKLYYAKLSQNGLQRLLQTNRGDDEDAEWTSYRSRGDVEVLRKTPAHFVCPTGGFASEKDRLVEMKAHVLIRSPPQRVFRHLRSLESTRTRTTTSGRTEDESHAMIRKVEPLDESRAVLYRSHPKLSLWPAWLVKPRDSCDLHSFVEKTGRPDTFAVLMESIPRADVPERKGVVRMAFATGGFLVEPSTGDEQQDVNADFSALDADHTRLTCVVRADFKGLMPRYLAESICYRQVLEIDAIRSTVEAQRPDSLATWV